MPVKTELLRASRGPDNFVSPKRRDEIHSTVEELKIATRQVLGHLIPDSCEKPTKRMSPVGDLLYWVQTYPGLTDDSPSPFHDLISVTIDDPKGTLRQITLGTLVGEQPEWEGKMGLNDMTDIFSYEDKTQGSNNPPPNSKEAEIAIKELLKELKAV